MAIPESKTISFTEYWMGVEKTIQQLLSEHNALFSSERGAKLKSVADSALAIAELGKRMDDMGFFQLRREGPEIGKRNKALKAFVRDELPHCDVDPAIVVQFMEHYLEHLKLFASGGVRFDNLFMKPVHEKSKREAGDDVVFFSSELASWCLKVRTSDAQSTASELDDQPAWMKVMKGQSTYFKARAEHEERYPPTRPSSASSEAQVQADENEEDLLFTPPTCTIL